MTKRHVEVDDLMQHGYTYRLSEPMGKDFHADFRPELTPKQLLALGVVVFVKLCKMVVKV